MLAKKKEYPLSKSSLLALRAVIKGCAAEASDLRKEIDKSTQRQRWTAWDKKRKLGQFTRHHLLAYGFLTGRAYLEIEPKRESQQLRATGSIPFGNEIDVEYLFYVCRQHLSVFAGKKLTIDNLRLWIDKGEPYFLTPKQVHAMKEAQKRAAKYEPYVHEVR